LGRIAARALPSLAVVFVTLLLASALVAATAAAAGRGATETAAPAASTEPPSAVAEPSPAVAEVVPWSLEESGRCSVPPLSTATAAGLPPVRPPCDHGDHCNVPQDCQCSGYPCACVKNTCICALP
jgi:hypothetical protein